MTYPYVNTATGLGEAAHEVHAAARAQGVSLSNAPSDADLAVIGRARVQPTEPPMTDVASEIQPVLVDGVWCQAWDSRPLTETERAERLQSSRLSRQAENNLAYEDALASLTAGYPQGEIATWERQRAEALSYAADAAAATPWIDIAAAARGIPRGEYLSRTLAKANAFAQASAYLTGLRQRYDDQIKAAADEAALNAIALDYAVTP